MAPPGRDTGLNKESRNTNVYRSQMSLFLSRLTEPNTLERTAA